MNILVTFLIITATPLNWEKEYGFGRLYNMWTNYKLTKLLIAKTGVIYGQNKFGSEWLELRWKGSLVKTVYLTNHNPQKQLQPSIEIIPSHHVQTLGN